MSQRMPDANTHLPEIQQLAGLMVRSVGNGSVPATTTSLVYLRAGHIVGSTYQVIRHSADLRKAGEPEHRINAVATWPDAPYFTEPERAALALTDAVFTPAAPGAERVPEALFTETTKHYDDKAMATLMMTLATAGFWMNIALVSTPDPLPA